MRHRRAVLVLAAAAGVLLTMATAQGQVASALVSEGDPNVIPGFGPVGSFDGPELNGIGGWAMMLTATDPNGVSRDIVWGSLDGVAAPTVFFKEGTYGGYVQSSWEYAFGFDDAGNVGYSATGTDPNGRSFDSAWINDTIVVMRYQSPPPPLDALYWSFASGPGLTAGGDFWVVGGTNESPSSSSTNRGLFDGNGNAYYFGGDTLPGMPAFIDPGATPAFDTRFSPYAGSYISEVEAETTGTGVPSTANNCMIMDGAVLTIDGNLVIEGYPVPASAGGLAGENWDNFDYMSINDVGGYIFTGDSDAATTEDEFVCVSGQIALREGAVLPEGDVSGAIEMAAINQQGDWAVVWDINDTTMGAGNIECLIFNGDVVLREALDDIDIDNDGIANPGARISGTSAFAGFRALRVGDRDPNGDVAIYVVADVSDNGATEAEMLLHMVVPTDAGTPDDLELIVTDAPDPLVALPGKITYTVRAINNGNTPLTGVTVVSTLDPGLAFDAGSSDPIAVHSGEATGGTVTASIGALPAFGVQVYKFVVDVTTAGDYTTTSTASANEADSVPANNDDSDTTTAGASTDLSIEISDVPDPITDPNGILVYTVTVANGGPSNATGVSAAVTLDANTSFISSTLATHDGSPTGGVATANIGAMPSGDSVEFDVTVQVLSQGTVTAMGDVTGTQDDPFLDNNTYSEDTLFELSADMAVSISDAPDPVAPVGGQITYTVDYVNNGPSPANNVAFAVVLDADTAFVSTSAGAHDGSPTGGVVSGALGALAPSAAGQFTIVVDTLAAGRLAATATIVADEIDPDAANNESPTVTWVLNNFDAIAEGVYSNIIGHPTAKVPGLEGFEFQNFDRPYLSPNTKLWVLTADTDDSTATDELILVGSYCGGAIFAQEGVTTLDPNDIGDQIGFIDQKVSINDSGDFAFTTNTNGATGADEVVVKYDADADAFVTIAREGDLAAPAGANYSTVIGAANILQNGQVWFIADTDLADTDLDYFVFSKNGNIAVAQEGVTIPTGQMGPITTEAWDLFDSLDLWTNADGTSWAAEGDLEGDTTTDKIFAVDNDVKIQEGIIIPGSGFTSPADASSPTDYAEMFSDGTWMARGGNDDDQDWVVQNGVVIAATGEPVTPGSSELWSDAPYSVTYFQFTVNNHGDTIVSGTTNSGDNASNAILVLNGTTVISRENDPIDLDGDGVLDPNADYRIRTYGNDDLVLTDDFQAYTTVTMRAFNDSGSDADVGDAFIRFNLCGVVTSLCADLNGDGIVNNDDYAIMRDAIGHTSCDAAYHACADYDGDGLVSFVDYQQWLACYRNEVAPVKPVTPADLVSPTDRAPQRATQGAAARNR